MKRVIGWAIVLFFPETDDSNVYGGTGNQMMKKREDDIGPVTKHYLRHYKIRSQP